MAVLKAILCSWPCCAWLILDDGTVVLSTQEGSEELARRRFVSSHNGVINLRRLDERIPIAIAAGSPESFLVQGSAGEWGEVETRPLVNGLWLLRLDRCEMSTGELERRLRKYALQHKLTPCEARVLRGLGRGRTLKEIAVEKQTGYDTVRNQLKSIYDRTGTHSQLELVLSALGSSNRQDGSS